MKLRDSAARAVKHSLTKRDNQTYDVVRIMWALGVNTFLLLSALRWETFEPAVWGAGFGLVMAAGGAATIASDKLVDDTRTVATPDATAPTTGAAEPRDRKVMGEPQQPKDYPEPRP